MLVTPGISSTASSRSAAPAPVPSRLTKPSGERVATAKRSNAVSPRRAPAMAAVGTAPASPASTARTTSEVSWSRRSARAHRRHPTCPRSRQRCRTATMAAAPLATAEVRELAPCRTSDVPELRERRRTSTDRIAGFRAGLGEDRVGPPAGFGRGPTLAADPPEWQFAQRSPADTRRLPGAAGSRRGIGEEGVSPLRAVVVTLTGAPSLGAPRDLALRAPDACACSVANMARLSGKRNSQLNCSAALGGALPTWQTVPKKIEVTCVASGFLDHVNDDPAEVDRSDPERRDRRNFTERVAPAERGAASLARRRVQLDDAVDAVTEVQPHGVVGIVGPRHVPGCRHLHTPQPALEPAVLGPCQVLDDARDRQVRRRQQARRGFLPPKVDERCGCDRPVVIEALHESCALVPRLEIRMPGHGSRHVTILAPSGRRSQFPETCHLPPGGARHTVTGPSPRRTRDSSRSYAPR